MNNFCLLRKMITLKGTKKSKRDKRKMMLLFHMVHLLYRPVQEQAFPPVPWDSASLEELRKGPKCAVTCSGRRRGVGSGRRGEARWTTPSKNWKHAASRQAPLKRSSLAPEFSASPVRLLFQSNRLFKRLYKHVSTLCTQMQTRLWSFAASGFLFCFFSQSGEATS